MRCPNCAADNPEGSKFCSACGGEINLKPLPAPEMPDMPVQVEDSGENPPAVSEPGLPPGDSALASDAVAALHGAFNAPKAEVQTVFKEVELCAMCSGAFPIGDLIDFHGKLYCPICKAREIKESKRKEGLQSSSPPPQNDYEQRAEPGMDQMPGPDESRPPSEWKQPAIAFSRQREPAEHRTYVLVAVVICVLVATLIGVVVFFLLSDPFEQPSGPMVPVDTTVAKSAESGPVSKAPASHTETKKPKEEPKKPDKPDPLPEDDIVSYQPRWFVGTYLGPNKEVQDAPQEALIFMSDQNQPVYITGVLDIYNVGKKYKFKFRPSRKYFESNVINSEALEIHPMVEEPEKTPPKPDDKKNQYPRKNVVLVLDDGRDIQGDLLCEDAENYTIREKESRGEIKIPKSKVLRID